MKGRTYRYFDGTPLYPFGYGLSYTTFSYSGLNVPTTPVKAGEPVDRRGHGDQHRQASPATKSRSSISASRTFPARRCERCAASSASTSNPAHRRRFTSS